MIGSDSDPVLIWLPLRVYSLRVSSSGTNAGTAHFVGPERISVDPSLLVNTCRLAAKGKCAWPGQVVEGILSQGLCTAGGDWAVHSDSCCGPTTPDPVKGKRRMGVRASAGRCPEHTSVRRCAAAIPSSPEQNCRQNLRQYFPAVIVSLLSRVQTSKTDKFVYHFVYFLTFVMGVNVNGLSPDYLIEIVEQIQGG